jgi:hypothetical protein
VLVGRSIEPRFGSLGRGDRCVLAGRGLAPLVTRIFCATLHG